MSSNMSSPKAQCQSLPINFLHQQQIALVNYELLDKSSYNTLKRNPKMELNKSDLLKLLSYLEGELQARDIVIAALKSEKVKQLLTQGRYRLMSHNEPTSALQRDAFAAAGPKVDEAQIYSLADHQLNSLENLVIQQRRSQIRIARVLKDAEFRHRKVVQELVEEKQKHEHDTAQGDDITYGLEKERTRLKQELETERQAKRRLEKEQKKIGEMVEEEKMRQKQIVLLLLAERKKIVMKYVEERKRSEDLAQILAEEKGRIDSMAEELEEESKKSLEMEAELEKQLVQFDMESQQLKDNLQKEEQRAKVLELELDKSRNEAFSLEKQLAEAHHVAMFQANTNTVHSRPPQPASKPTVLPPQTSPRLTPSNKTGSWVTGDCEPAQPQAGTAMMSSVAKVVQPTATVSSVPVCGPTTGIARSISPGQGLRGVIYSSSPVIPVSQPPQTPLTEVEKKGSCRAGVITSAKSSKPFQIATVGNANDGAKKTLSIAMRGMPPPVPPNKPIVPPKKDPRKVDLGSSELTESQTHPKFGLTVTKDGPKHHHPILPIVEATESKREIQ